MSTILVYSVDHYFSKYTMILRKWILGKAFEYWIHFSEAMSFYEILLLFRLQRSLVDCYFQYHGIPKNAREQAAQSCQSLKWTMEIKSSAVVVLTC